MHSSIHAEGLMPSVQPLVEVFLKTSVHWWLFFFKIQPDSFTEDNEELSAEKGDGLIAILKYFLSSWLVEKGRSGFLKEFIARTKALLELF